MKFLGSRSLFLLALAAFTITGISLIQVAQAQDESGNAGGWEEDGSEQDDWDDDGNSSLDSADPLDRQPDPAAEPLPEAERFPSSEELGEDTNREEEEEGLQISWFTLSPKAGYRWYNRTSTRGINPSSLDERIQNVEDIPEDIRKQIDLSVSGREGAEVRLAMNMGSKFGFYLEPLVAVATMTVVTTLTFDVNDTTGDITAVHQGRISTQVIEAGLGMGMHGRFAFMDPVVMHFRLGFESTYFWSKHIDLGIGLYARVAGGFEFFIVDQFAFTIEAGFTFGAQGIKNTVTNPQTGYQSDSNMAFGTGIGASLLGGFTFP